MRAEFAEAMVRRLNRPSNTLFLTGDLGYMALEKVREAYGDRFINAGVAEQNMISVAAGLAREGFIPWVYSIASFALLRPYEQIRNDVCLHHLPVKIVGNGGGYGYGIMGATHHILEDLALMRVLPNMRIYVPLISSDVDQAVELMNADDSPNYLRLNQVAKLPAPIGSFQPWRKIKDGRRIVVIGAGPVVQNLLEIPDQKIIEDLEIWCVGVFPLSQFPEGLLASIRAKKRILTLEEHYGQGGLQEAVAGLLLSSIDFAVAFKGVYAKGYPSGKYGNQKWHQEENGLGSDGLAAELGAFYE